MIDVQGLSVQFDGKTILRDITFSAAKGEHIAIIGASGAGKSALLRCLNGLVKPASGAIRIGNALLTDGGAQAQRARHMTGMVFQQFNLFTHLRVVDNIALAPIRVAHTAPAVAIAEAEALLELVGLSDKRNAYPASLSGGQQQRVAIARALAMHPSVLLFDEPTSALDPTTSAEVLALIRRISEDSDRTIVVVTHEMSFVKAIANRVFFIADASIYEEGTPLSMLGEPKREKTKAFLQTLVE